MAGIIEFVKEYFPLIRTVLTAIAGLLLMLAGLGTFRKFFSPLCAILGLVVGLALHSAFPRDEMLIVAAMCCIAGGVIGYENYKCALVLASTLSAFIASAVFVLRRLYEDITLGIEEADVIFVSYPNRMSILRVWYMRIRYEGDLKEAMSVAFKNESGYTLNQVSQVFDKAADALQIGLGIALIIGVFTGILSLLLDDYIVILSTTALGSVMLVGLIDETEFLKQLQYNYKLAIFILGGAVFQFARYYKSIVKESQKKKRRGLYEKKR
ncbi:MAG: hypothetical protein K5686_05515 [Lachnospiraceae bacterium]|nr:hypothetical protein [Lachnospiraceae bacterium]